MNPQTSAKIAQSIRSSPRALVQRFEMFYVYNAPNPPVIAQGATATFGFTAQADYDFAVYAINVAIVDQTAFTPVLAGNSTGLINIQDTGAGANWFANPVAIADIAGTGQLPGNLPVIRIVAKSATLSFTITNIKDGTAALGVIYYVDLIGSKLATQNPGNVGLMG